MYLKHQPNCDGVSFHGHSNACCVSQVNASDRVVELSKAKKLSDGYQSCRNVVWRVNAAAKNATASSRMEELSKPIIRETMDHVQFNPDAFEVSTSAKKYKATGRIEELAKPILR